MPYTTLISAERLTTLMRSDSPPCILDCRMRLGQPEAGLALFQQGHIPGSAHADLETRLVGKRTPKTGRHPLPERDTLAAALAALGLDADQQLVVYDDQGGAMAARLWWMARWAGHAQVAVLDGGLQAWTESGGDLEDGVRAHPPGNFVLGKPLVQWIDPQQLEEALQAQDITLIDARAEERFSGASEPYDPVAGHIPGAVNVPFASNLAADGRFKPVESLREMYQPLMDSTRVPIAMCGSGITACHTLLALEHAGLARGRLYVGSWSEWITDPARPVAREA
ncbi:sulfurtransferase [Methylonatrum kenyense]|uniref:sulfurtransferase n=1 Tax=Methylonatrum kenyense TaxID=455253 RepID=UPI0020BD7053|nr:sulfurtransferase [Methylonatrum kenyense]MCK8515689.1 sulfurtransferase [Methylonatrum kenyense]